MAPTPQTYANFGTRIRMSGDLVVVTAPSEDESATLYDTGAAYLYQLAAAASRSWRA
jgi:hypothetical protein